MSPHNAFPIFVIVLYMDRDKMYWTGKTWVDDRGSAGSYTNKVSAEMVARLLERRQEELSAEWIGNIVVEEI